MRLQSLRAQTKIPRNFLGTGVPTRFVGTLLQHSTNIPRKHVGTVVPQGFLEQYYRTAPNVQEHLWEQVFPRDLWELSEHRQKFPQILWEHMFPHI